MSRTSPGGSTRHAPWALAMALYLLGIFMGAIDTGIVTPARTVIQRDLHVDDQLGIWMITIYTLSYAAAIPIMGKLADRLGRKPVYLLSIALFGLGSLACGLSQDFGSFPMLIAARAVQAIGGGGILPIATAEIGTEVPPERRGMALGLVGAVYGIANIFGASAGSLILDVAGVHNWQWIFYVNVPIAIAIIGVGLAVLPNRRENDVLPIDVLGSLLLVAMILSLLYGLRNIDFFDFGNSIRSVDVWPFLVAFAVLVPLFVLAERRAFDPVLNLRYFTDFGHGGVLLLSMLAGVALMAVVFVPQFAENALRLHSGGGGYTVIALGLASGIGAPISGTLTDKFGPKRVLALGAGLSLGAAACALFWAIPQPGTVSVFASLVLFGLGLGFVIGSPLNYMMLQRTPASESNSALGTLSLMRSIGTTLAPAIMVGFLAQAGVAMQDRLLDQLPTSVPAPVLPYAAELQAKFDELKNDENLKDKLAGVEFPDLTSKSTIQIDTDGGGTLPDDLVDSLKDADVTNIVERVKDVARYMFAQKTPQQVADIQSGVRTGIDSLDAAASELDQTASDMANSIGDMDSQLAEMESGLKKMDAQLATFDHQLAEMASGLKEMDSQLAKLDGQIAQMGDGIAGMDSALAGLDQAIAGAQQGVSGIDEGLAQQNAALEPLVAQREALPDDSPAAPALDAQIAGLRAAIEQLQAQRDDAASQLGDLTGQKAALTAQRAELVTAREGAQTGRRELAAARDKLQTGRAGVTKARAGVATARDQLRTGHEELTKAHADLVAGREKVVAAQADLAETKRQMTVLSDAVPGAFDAALASYLDEIDARGPQLETTFQSTLGEGFRGVFAVYGFACVLMLVLLPFIPRRRVGEPA